MNVKRDADAILAAWLEDGPNRLPEATRRSIGVAARSTDQRRRPVWAPWRLPHMNSYARLAVAAVVVVAVGAMGLALLRPSGASEAGGVVLPSLTPLPTAPATPSPSSIPLTDTSNWVPFTSTRYGYSIELPPTWTATPSTRNWTMRDAADWVSPAQDEFIDQSAAYEIGVHGFASDIPKGTSADQWINMYSGGLAPAGQCQIQPSHTAQITVDGHAGKFVDQPACSDTIAFVPIGGRLYVFTIGRAQQLPLFGAFLSTVRFLPTASPSPSASSN
jgi:hypothetical protein